MKMFYALLPLLIEILNQINSTYNTDENKYDTCCRGMKQFLSHFFMQKIFPPGWCVKGVRKSLIDQARDPESPIYQTKPQMEYWLVNLIFIIS